MEFTAWTLFVDVGLMSLLLLFGFLIRSKVRFVQNLFLPASLLAGFMGLILGPNGFNLLPFSASIGKYSGILIALVFAALPLASQKVPFKTISKRVGNMWAYSQSVMILQWGLGALFGLVVIKAIWGDVNPGFGLMLASGFSGGHGTAAAIGDAFAGHGWDDAATLAMTSATVGVVSAIVGGLIIIKMGSRKGFTKFITDFEDLPTELKTGLIPEENRESAGNNTVSPISVDPLLFHLALISGISVLGYYIAKFGAKLMPQIRIPTFCVAFIVGVILMKVFENTGADKYIDKRIVTRISGSATDMLVAFGIASIKLPVVVAYAGPLALLFLFGLAYCWFMFRVLGPRMFTTYWFEKSIFTWGWATGTMAMGIALLKIIDPDLKSKTLDDFALAYIPMSPVEIAVVSFAPLLFVNGQGWTFTAVTVGFGIAVLLFAYMKGWLKQNQYDVQDKKAV
ncbi:MAG: sodium:glutamate symporter [Clostridiales bacterium]|nr:MAG: sodium:glutamate symporter [Clostridiales bacterium]